MLLPGLPRLSSRLLLRLLLALLMPPRLLRLLFSHRRGRQLPPRAVLLQQLRLSQPPLLPSLLLRLMPWAPR